MTNDSRLEAMGDTPGRKCPECGYPLPTWKASHPDLMEALTFCGGCGVQVLDDDTVGYRSQAEWAEHYDGDILRIPRIVVPDDE